MTTKLIGLKDFRLNLTSYTEEAETKQIRFIVFKKNKPVLEINPITQKEITLESLQKEISEAREQVKKGKVYTLNEAKKILGL